MTAAPRRIALGPVVWTRDEEREEWTHGDGDAACVTTAAALSAIDDAREIVRGLVGREEWMLDSPHGAPWCQPCWRSKEQGHAPSCDRAAAFAWLRRIDGEAT